MKRYFITLIAVAAALACKDGSGPDGGGVTFPSLPGGLLATYCVRG